MSGTEIALISTFGSIGYLLIGWATMVVVAARSLDFANRIQLWSLWAVPLWPAFWLVGLVVGSVVGAKPVTEGAIKKLNPQARSEWF